MIYHDSGMCTVLLEALGFIHVQPFLQQNLMALFGLTVVSNFFNSQSSEPPDNSNPKSFLLVSPKLNTNFTAQFSWTTQFLKTIILFPLELKEHWNTL